MQYPFVLEEFQKKEENGVEQELRISPLRLFLLIEKYKFSDQKSTLRIKPHE